MRLKEYFQNGLGKIYDPAYIREYKPKYNIWPIRLAIMVFLVFNFHWLNKYPLFSISVVTISELLFGLYILIMFIFTRGILTAETQLAKLILDLFFITLFEYISISLYGSFSGLSVLFVVPVIYCSYWFKWYVSVVFVSIVAFLYSLLNYNLLVIGTRFESSQDIIRLLGPMYMLLYLVAGGGYFFKRKIQLSREAEYVSQEFTQNLLESSFDAIITVDERGKIADVNERACELFGYDLKELKDIIGHKVVNFYAVGEAKRVVRALRESKNGRIENFKTLILTKSGEEIPILSSATFLYDKKTLKEELSKGKRFSTLSYFRDIRADEAFDIIAKEITAIANELELLEKIVETVAKLLKAEACSLLTYHERSGKLKVVTSYGMPEILQVTEKFESYSEEEGMVGRCLKLEETLNVSNIDVKKEEPKDMNIKWKYAKNFAEYSRFGDFKHFLVIPLFVKGEAYGVLRVLNKYTADKGLDERGFTYSDRELLDRFSNQVSILVEKVRDKERFESILKVGNKLNEMLEVPLEQMLQLIAEEVVKGMRFHACYLRLVEENDILRIKACAGLEDDYKGLKVFDLKIGEGVSGDVVRSAKYSAIEDLSTSGHYKFKNIVQRENLKAMLSIPLKYRGRVIGVISCYTSRPHQFTEQEIQIMHTFANYASTAIQNKKRVDEFKALNEISNELAKPIGLNELFHLILKKAKTFSGADRLCLKIYDEQERIVKTSYSLGCPWHEKHPQLISARWDEYGNKAAEEVFKTGKSKIMPNYNEIMKRTKRLPDFHLVESIQSCALVPVTIDERVYGVIFLESERPDFFTIDDLLLLEAFSSQAAIALKNTNFLNKLQRVTETFPRISELNVDIDKALENIADIAAEVLAADVLVLYYYDEKNDKVEWPPIVSGSLLYPEYMILPVDERDAPYLFLKRRCNHFANKSLYDTVLSPNIEPRSPIPSRFVVREQIASSAGILLSVGREIVGVMFVNYRDSHNFNEYECKIILNYASYIAIAIQNVRHFKEKESFTALDSLRKLAATVAHNMKGDIGTIRLYNDDLMEGTNPNRPEYDHLSRIKDRINNITDDIDYLLKSSRLQKPVKEVANLKKLVAEIEKDIKPELTAKDIHYNMEIKDGVPELIIDPVQIKMVFSNLIYNSIAAMPSGGNISLLIGTKGEDVLIHWQDTGPGIPLENAPKVFEPFWTTKGKGFGLGLFLSKWIIEEHGGSMVLDIDNKMGAKFVIRIPVKGSLN
jgi:PAS domain S-box-containing protein